MSIEFDSDLKREQIPDSWFLDELEKVHNRLKEIIEDPRFDPNNQSIIFLCGESIQGTRVSSKGEMFDRSMFAKPAVIGNTENIGSLFEALLMRNTPIAHVICNVCSDYSYKQLRRFFNPEGDE